MVGRPESLISPFGVLHSFRKQLRASRRVLMHLDIYSLSITRIVLLEWWIYRHLLLYVVLGIAIIQLYRLGYRKPRCQVSWNAGCVMLESQYHVSDGCIGMRVGSSPLRHLDRQIVNVHLERFIIRSELVNLFLHVLNFG